MAVASDAGAETTNGQFVIRQASATFRMANHRGDGDRGDCHVRDALTRQGGKNAMKPQHAAITLPWIVRLRAAQRLAIAVAVGAVAFLMLSHWGSAQTRWLVTWNLGSWVYLSLAAMVIARADAAMTRARVQTQDQSGYVIFLLVVSAASASIIAIGFLMGEVKNLAFWPRTWHLALSIAALISSWLLIHTLFAFHYARRYYGDHRRGKDFESDGLLFPGGQPPDYLDFAYYSFVVGMTSQVSDVTVTTRFMRRLTLIHGVLSFVFNIAILAMSINIIASVI
jgi:uncharacterized membrane protein